jgi:DNA (cytosine-5)-methyltransferase 1
MHRLIREIRPKWVIAENVGGHVERGLDTVLSDLDAAGYTAWTFIIPACAVGAPHWRDRVWIVAHATGIRLPRSLGPLSQQFAQALPSSQVWWDLPTPFTCGGNDGIPDRMDRTSALGNAVVPQIPEVIGRAIIACEQ